MKEKIDPQTLQIVVNLLYERFNLFFLRLRRGVFWHYFDKNNVHFTIEHENSSPCASISSNENKGYIIKVLYHNNRISVEAFHSITDGNGVAEYLKSIVYYYVSIKEKKRFDSQNKILLFNEFSKDEWEDSFTKNFSKSALIKHEKIKEHNSFRIKGKRFKKNGHAVIHGILSVKSLKLYCKNHECTITAFLIASLIMAIHKDNLDKMGRKPIVVSVPVNLRNSFESNTLKNFFGVVNISYDFKKESTVFKDLLKSVAAQLTKYTQEANLERLSAKNVKISKNIFSRYTPLIIKNRVMPIGFTFMGENKKTISLSNVGIFNFPDDIKPYVDLTEVLIYPTEKSPINCAICSFDDKLNVSFTKTIKNTTLEREFFTGIASETGTDICVYSNQWGEEDE